MLRQEFCQCCCCATGLIQTRALPAFPFRLQSLIGKVRRGYQPVVILFA